MSRRDEPMPLRDAISAVSRDLGMPTVDALAILANVWPDVVGSALAQHARVRSVQNGECVVEVDGPVWATQLRYLGADLAARCNERCGTPVVSSVRVVVARP